MLVPYTHNTYHIIYKKFYVIRTYRKCSWIIWYINTCIWNMFFIKFCVFIESYKLLDLFLTQNYEFFYYHKQIHKFFHNFPTYIYHYLYLPIIVNHLRELWQKLYIFCGTRFFTKLLSYLIEPNKIACSWGLFFPLLSFSYKIWTTHCITLSYLQIAFYTTSKILSNYFLLLLLLLQVYQVRIPRRSIMKNY